MKKLYILLFPLLLLTGYAAQSQCTNTFQFGTVTIPANNSIVTISTCSFAGDYSTINGAINGQTLRFTSSVATDFITIRSGTPGGPVLAMGVTPLQFANTFTGTVYAHWNTNAACGTQNACRTTTVQCTSCPPSAGGCTFTSAFGTATINPTGAIVTISTCSFAGEYSTILGAVNGQTLRFTSSVATDFITIHTGTPSGPIVAFGTTPLVFANTFTGTIYAHWATNAACGTQSTCRTTTVQCTNCSASAPPNDLCTGALPITCGATVTGNTATATIDVVPTCITTFGTAPGVWYSFVGTGLSTTLSLCGSGYDTKVGVFSGTCAALVCVTGNDDFCGLQSSVTFPAALGTTYYILVTGFGAATGAFTMTATCAAPIPNDNCTGALPLGCGATVTGTTAGTTIDVVPTCVTTFGTSGGVWYTFVGNGAANTLTMCTGTTYDSKIGVFTGTCAALVCVTGNDDFCGLQSQVTFATTLGTTYYVLITGFGTATGAFTLTRTSAPLPNDVCTGAININCGQTLTGSTSCGATIDAVGTCITALGTAPGLWYQFVGDGSPVTISLCGSGYDTKLGIFTGTCTALVCVTGNDDFCGLQSQVTFNTNAGFTYYILVTGFNTATGNFTLARTCAPACAGVPSPGSITPATSTACVGANVTLTCSGYSANSQLTFQWYSAPAAAGPYTLIAGATSNVYTFPAPPATTYYRCVVTCTNGGGNATTAPAVVNVSNIQFTSAIATPSTVCSPGSVTISATVTGGLNLGNYTYTLTGPGTIGPAVPSGPNNSSVSFAVTQIPAGNQVYTLTATDPVPCSKSTTINVTVNLTPVVTLAPPGTCVYSYTGPAVAVPDNVPGGVNIPLTVAGLTNPIADLDFRFDINGTCDPTPGNVNAAMDHTFIGDLIFKLTSPLGTTVTIVNRRGGTRENICATLLDDDSGFPSLSTVTSTSGQSLSGNFAPDNPLSAFDGQNGNGTWILNVSDNAGIDIGSMRRYSLLFQCGPIICNGAIQPITGTVTTGAGTFVFSPLTELFTDAPATIAYTGTALASGTTIYAKPTVTRTYTATVTSAEGCSSSTPITITVNQLPAITSQPSPATQTICPGFNVTYTVGATGAGLTYQWRRNGVNLVNGPQINLSTISGATTNTLTITNVGAANAGNYDVVVSGTCPPPVTSNTVVLLVASAPTITTQPVNTSICAMGGIPSQAVVVLTVVATGVPPPTIFQWQVSTDNGATWTNLVNTASTASPYYNNVFSPALTIGNANLAMNGYRYRLVITNICGQSVTSNAVTLTVNAIPVVVATDLFNRRVCLSDTLIPLVGTPVGGFWSGIGVSGFNFVPSATAVGTFVLTYTHTNTAGCTISDTTSVKVQDCPERLRLLTKDALKIYPNPNNGHFFVKMNSTLYNYLGMRVYNMSGQLMIGNAVTNPATNRETLVMPVYTGLVYGRVIPIDLSMLTSGTYLVEFYYDDGIRTSKKGFLIMIQK